MLCKQEDTEFNKSLTIIFIRFMRLVHHKDIKMW